MECIFGRDGDSSTFRCKQFSPFQTRMNSNKRSLFVCALVGNSSNPHGTKPRARPTSTDSRNECGSTQTSCGGNKSRDSIEIQTKTFFKKPLF